MQKPHALKQQLYNVKSPLLKLADFPFQVCVLNYCNTNFITEV